VFEVVTVRTVEPGVVDKLAGLKVAVAPGGRPVTGPKLTPLVKPLTDVVEMAYVVLAVSLTVFEFGDADRLNVGDSMKENMNVP
jgi:hypothetical protein